MLHVVIVGAGISGLAAAVSLRRAGHRVELYEQSSLNNEIGAAITVPPNASRILSAWGVRPEEWGFVLAENATINDPFTMETLSVLLRENTALRVGGMPLYLAHRVDLHNCMKWLATQQDGPGIPAKIHCAGKVAVYDPRTPSITLQDGRTIYADIVVGADGVHSRAAEAVLQHTVEAIEPVHSNFCYRFLIHGSVLEADPHTKEWNVQNKSRTRVFADNKTQRRVVSYPCRNNTIYNFVGLFHDRAMRTGTEDWHAKVKVEEVIARFGDFHPDIVNVIRKANDVRRWPLLYRRPLDKWYRDMLVLVGDAAHPMLPHQGQGGAQGIEDGLALGIVLHGATSKDDIGGRFQVYQAVRRNRASVIQLLSNIGQDQVAQLKSEVLPFLEEDKIPTNPEQICKFNFGYNAVEATLEAMSRYEPGFSLPASFFEHEVAGVPPPPPPPPPKTTPALMNCGGETNGTDCQAVGIL